MLIFVNQNLSKIVYVKLLFGFSGALSSGLHVLKVLHDGENAKSADINSVLWIILFSFGF